MAALIERLRVRFRDWLCRRTPAEEVQERERLLRAVGEGLAERITRRSAAIREAVKGL
jgi:hypothetical protein